MAKAGTATELGTERIGKLLMQYAIPAIIAMTASSLYNMVDSIFIGHGVGPLAISGLAITFPLMNLAAAFGSLVGVGASTLVSVRLGQKDYDTAQHILGNVITLNLIIGIGFTILTLLFLDPILYFFGASADTISYARDYMYIILLGNVVTHMYLGLNALLRASGHPQKAMIATITTVIINTLLDPIFIYIFKWGIEGAAIATILAQIISLTWQFKTFTNKNELLHLRHGIYKLRGSIVKNTIAIGMSPFLMNVCACAIVIIINNSLQNYGGDMAIGAYGIVNRIIFLFVMIIMGFNQGMQPIAGYNFGARQLSRMIQVLKYTTLCAITVTTLGFLICQIFPRTIIRMFTGDSDLIDIAEHGMRLILLFFPLVGFQMVSSSFFQSIGMAGKAIFLSLTRQLIFLLPCLLILPHYWGTDGVWGSIPVADFIASITTGLMLGWQLKKFKTGGLNNTKDSVAL